MVRRPDPELTDKEMGQKTWEGREGLNKVFTFLRYFVCFGT